MKILSASIPQTEQELVRELAIQKERFLQASRAVATSAASQLKPSLVAQAVVRRYPREILFVALVAGFLFYPAFRRLTESAPKSAAEESASAEPPRPRSRYYSPVAVA